MKGKAVDSSRQNMYNNKKGSCILDFIIKEMNRSATVEKAYGAYTHHELSVLVTVLTRRQALQLRNFLRENDPRSFITIVNSSEIIGKGFRSFN